MRVIEVRDAKKWIQNGARRVEILKGISLTIPAGQFVAIVGASGSGKSTLLGLLAGLDTPSEGEIWLDGVPIHNLAEARPGGGARAQDRVCLSVVSTDCRRSRRLKMCCCPMS